MATYTPPPYFPQSSLAPPDEKRYRKFKLIVALAGLVVVSLLGGLGFAIWYLIKWLF
jgi:nitrate reductase NapE component